MRVLVCPDRMGPLSSAEAGRALAAGWPEAQTRTAGDAGGGFIEATAAAWAVAVTTAMLDGLVMEWAAIPGTVVVGLSGPGRPIASPGSGDDPGRSFPHEAPIPYEASSLSLGQALTAVLGEHRPRRLLVDLSGLDVHDAGAGLLAGLGATSEGAGLTGGVAGLDGLEAVDLHAARDLLGDVELVGVVPSAHRSDQLLGLRGITSRRGHETGADLAQQLKTDAMLTRLTGLIAPDQVAAPGAGACGGLGWAVLALGGRLVTGPELALDGVEALDLLVTGCGVLDFASRGGGVVAAAAEVAAERLAPCVVIAGQVLIGSREMRAMGIEAAYAVRESSLDAPVRGGLTRDEVARTAVRVARSWRW